MGAIGGALGGSGLSSPVSSVVQILAANVEQPIIFPANTIYFRLRNGGDKVLKVSYQPGESDSEFLPCWPNEDFEVSGISAPSISVYVQSPGLIPIHIESWS